MSQRREGVYAILRYDGFHGPDVRPESTVTVKEVVRSQERLGAPIEEPPNTDNGTGMRAFVVRDLDGYHVAINEARR